MYTDPINIRIEMMSLLQCLCLFTSVVTAPGLFILIFLTVCNTSTTPSVLHCSIALLTAQYTPERLTVSLNSIQHHSMYIYEHNVSICLTYLQCTTVGPSPLFCCILMIDSTICSRVCGFVTLPSLDQLVIWYWATVHLKS